eukprot:s3910_g1.t1
MTPKGTLEPHAEAEMPVGKSPYRHLISSAPVAPWAPPNGSPKARPERTRSARSANKTEDAGCVTFW